MTIFYRRGRKHQRRTHFVQPVDLRLGGESSRIIYPRVAIAVARWRDQQRTVRSKREE